MMKSLCAAALAIVPFAVGCSSGDDEPTPEMEMQPAASNCETETRAEDYSAGMTKVGGNGVSVIIEDATPAPPAAFDNKWTLGISDAHGNPMEGAAVKVLPFMPDHGHPTNRESIITEMGSGLYEADPVNFMMAGYWTGTVDVETTDISDSVVFKFCIPG
jgi:hypothetical protein